MDIESRTDIERLLELFYQRAFADPLLGPIFLDVAHMDLDAHLPVITDFWEHVLFHTGAYNRGAFEVHRKLNEMVPLGSKEFGRWVELWEGSVADTFAGPNADRAVSQAHRFAGAFQRRLQNPTQPATIKIRPGSS